MEQTPPQKATVLSTSQVVTQTNSDQHQSSSQSHTISNYLLRKQDQTFECVEWLGCRVADRECGSILGMGMVDFYFSKGCRPDMECCVNSEDNMKRIVWFVTENCVYCMYVMGVCVCVCMYVCMYVCVCMYAFIYVCTYVCMCVCMYVCMYVCM